MMCDFFSIFFYCFKPALQMKNKPTHEPTFEPIPGFLRDKTTDKELYATPKIRNKLNILKIMF